MDEINVKWPFFGVPRMHKYLVTLGYPVNEKRIYRLFQIMGIAAIYPGPNTSKADKDHEIYPYLLKSVTISYSNHVWSTDITYIPMEKGFLYKVAFIDWHSRYILSYAISNTLDTSFVLVAFNEAIINYGRPAIVNTDQGSQFTSKAFIDALKANTVQISMDGKGRALDNIIIERYWRSYKYECVYLHNITDGWHLKDLTDEYIRFYNTERIHQSLDYQTPVSRYMRDRKTSGAASN
jgi:putative transposase